MKNSPMYIYIYIFQHTRVCTEKKKMKLFHWNIQLVKLKHYFSNSNFPYWIFQKQDSLCLSSLMEGWMTFQPALLTFRANSGWPLRGWETSFWRFFSNPCWLHCYGLSSLTDCLFDTNNNIFLFALPWILCLASLYRV